MVLYEMFRWFWGMMIFFSLLLQLKSFEVPYEFSLHSFPSVTLYLLLKVHNNLQPSCFCNDISLTFKENRAENDLICKIKTMIKLLMWKGLIQKIFAQSLFKNLLCFFFYSYLPKEPTCDSWDFYLFDTHISSLTFMDNLLLKLSSDLALKEVNYLKKRASAPKGSFSVNSV